MPKRGSQSTASGRVATGRSNGKRARAKAVVARNELTCRRRATTQRAKTFRRSDEGLAALLVANPELAMLLETDCSQGCRHYRHWRKGGRRGPKVPLRGQGEGRFDPLDLALDRKGKRRVTSWLEATYAAVPPSRKWKEFRERVPPLEETTGLNLVLPDAVYRLDDDEESFALCREQAERDLVATLAPRKRRARTRRGRSRRMAATGSERVPF